MNQFKFGVILCIVSVLCSVSLSNLANAETIPLLTAQAPELVNTSKETPEEKTSSPVPTQATVAAEREPAPAQTNAPNSVQPSAVPASQGAVIDPATTAGAELTVSAVAPPELASLSITPTTPAVLQTTRTLQFTVTGLMSDGTAATLSGLTWSSSDEKAATISDVGLATGLALGATDISVTDGKITSNLAPLKMVQLTGGAIQGSALELSTQVTTLAGTGVASSTDSTTGATATFNHPYGITTDGKNLYIADSWSNKIRQVVISSGVVTTLAGSGIASAADSATGMAATFNHPYGITTDGINLYVADSWSNKIRQIVISTGAVTTLAGSGAAGSADSATGTTATFNHPFGITMDGNNLYIADCYSNKIRQVAIATGAVTTVAGSGSQSSDDSTTGTLASFESPVGITTDGSRLFVTEELSNKIRQIVISTGEVTTLAHSATFNHPYGITTDGINLYVTDSWNNTIRQIVIASDDVTILVGSGVQSSTDSTTGTLATFNHPYGITSNGVSLFVADSYGNNIRQIQ